ncbi:MAG: ABC transporter permease [Eubacteriales bacterium]|nr:ABC transporter permease [Eubacteriales bacterium]
MLTTIIKRLLQGFVVIIAVMILVFVLLRLIPGDPARQMASIATEEAVQALREEMGLTKSIPEQLLVYINNLFHGNLGYSWFQKTDVSNVIAQAIGKTGQLIGLALVAAVISGFFFGLIAAVFHHSWIDQIISMLAVIFQSLPNYWLAILLIQVVSVKWGILPAAGYSGFKYVLFPAFILALPLSGIIAKNIRTNTIGSLSLDFVKAAKARGVPGAVSLFGYALRNSLIPIITLIGSQLGYLVGNCIIVEYIFSFPGIGLHTLNAILRRDYYLVQALVMLLSLVFIVVNTIIDISYLYLDPRIRKAQGGL